MIILVLIILAHLIVLSRLIFFPYPEFFIYPYLTNNGLIPYKQIFDQHFPGLMFFPINLGNLGMTSPESARVLQMSVVVVTHLILFLIARKIFKSDKLAIFANISYFLWQTFFEGWILWIDSIVPIFLLLSLYFLLETNVSKYPKKLFLAGLFLGISLLFKQVIVPLILLTNIYLWFTTKNIRDLFAFNLGIAFPVLVLVFYIISLGAWDDFIFWTVTFNLGTFAQMGRKFATLPEIIRTFFILGIPILATFAIYLKNKSKALLCVLFFTFGSLFFAYARFDLVHLQPAVVFTSLLVPFLFSKVSATTVKIILLIYLTPFLVLWGRFFQSTQGTKVFFYGETEKKLTQIIQEKTKREDKIFAFATTPHIYQLADRLPAGNVFVFPFPWFYKVAEEKLLEGIIKDKPKLILRDEVANVEGRLVDYAPKINDYINKNYFLSGKVDDTEVLLKK